MLVHTMRISQSKGKVVQNAILAMEIVLLPTGLISTLLMLKQAASCPFWSIHFLLATLRENWVRLRLSLSSSQFFMCMFINSIVVLILLTSSKFYHRKMETIDLFSYDGDNPTVVSAQPLPWTPPPMVATLSFVNQEDSGVDQNLETNDDEEERDTIEATWAAIGGGAGDEKQNMKLKKSDTWPRPPPQTTVEKTTVEPEMSLPSEAAAPRKELRKSMTFNDAILASRRGGLSRDLLRCPDELNKRFDDFIRKFNHELRLQRQASDERFLETINRGL